MQHNESYVMKVRYDDEVINSYRSWAQSYDLFSILDIEECNYHLKYLENAEKDNKLYK